MQRVEQTEGNVTEKRKNGSQRARRFFRASEAVMRMTYVIGG